MSDKTINPWWEIGVGAATIVACVAFYLDSLRLPDPVFDPLGSVVVPRVTCWVLGVFASAMLIQGWSRLRRATDTVPPAGGGPGYTPRPALAAVIFGLTGLYIAALSTRLVPFSELTLAFVFLSGALMTRFRLSSFPMLLVLAAIMGYGGHFVFTEVFYVDLP